ncbi:hypothetical protein BDN67DRAFT_1018068 [Paxillus ammoniavirescens]|nr:hypothetical protein BDN67DRAFT_1018068 [Paxillus ammoniavirescens]
MSNLNSVCVSHVRVFGITSNRLTCDYFDNRQAVGEEDEVGGANDGRETSYRVNEGQSRRGEVRDQAEDDEEDQEDEGRLNDGEKRRTMATNANEHGGETVAPEDKSPSVWLKGESGKQSSLYVKADHVEMVDDNNHVKEDHDTQTAPRDPVGTSDSVKRHPNEPTEPPDKEEGARRGNGEMKVDRRVEMEESSRVDQPGGRGGNEDETRRDEGQTGGKDKDKDGQRDG